ncbi:hypothetical protein [Candidatus Blastococcus massiliensis]|uniref:hypothetical protein n=1 Tax=Candidatus Blastococcus massiliensis TaxID=1470358 RepID=UPI0004B7CB9C|nr:hypothetical protein [Candidatus Blastococcus massiliensis]
MTFERSRTELGHGRTTGRLRFAVVPLVLASLALTACAAAEGADEEALAAPEACVDTAAATRNSVDGTPVWARFCPGPERHTLPAEVPSDALTTHLDLLAGLEERGVESPPAGWPCSELSGGAPTRSRSGTPTARS